MGGATSFRIFRADERYRTRSGGIESYHSFSFGAHYDAANVAWGPLVAVNDEQLDAGAGFPMHQHRDVEIVTWVVSGRVEHGDSLGGRHVLEPGGVGLLHAGTGVRHQERSAGDEGARFVQMWLAAPAGGRPYYRTTRVETGVPSAAVAGRPPAPVRLAIPGASLRLLSPHPDREVTVPAGPLGYLHCLTGEAEFATGTRRVQLHPGDALRLARTGGLLRGVSGASLLHWLLPPPARPG